MINAETIALRFPWECFKQEGTGANTIYGDAVTVVDVRVDEGVDEADGAERV